MAVSKNDAIRMIRNSDKIQFGWSRKRNYIGHTAVAVLLDNEPAFTIDYGPDEDDEESSFLASSSRSAAAASEFSLGIGMNLWSRRKSFMEDVLFSTRCVRTAIQVVEMIGGLLMGDYSTLLNNCRHFVIKAVKHLKQRARWDQSLDMHSADLKMFDYKIEKVKSKDYRRAGAAIGGAIVASLLCTIS